MTLKEAAKYLRVTPLTLRRWDNRIKHAKINSRGDRRYLKKDIDSWLESR